MFIQPGTVYKLIFGVIFVLLGSESFGQLMRIDSLKNQLNNTKDSIQFVNIQIELSKEYSTRKIDSSFFYASKALETSNRIQYPYGKAESQSVLALHFMEMANPYMAYLHINRAMDIYNKVKDLPNLANLHKNLGILFMREGNQSQAEESFNAALAIIKDLPNDSLSASVYYNYASLKFYNAPYQEVEKLFLQGAEVLKRHPDARLTFLTQQALLNLQLFHKYPQKQVLSEQIKLTQSLKHDEWYGYHYPIATFELGISYLGLHLDSARKYMESAYNFVEAMGNDYLKYHFIRKGFDHLHVHYPNSDLKSIYEKRFYDISLNISENLEKYKMDFFQLALREKDLEINAAHVQQRQIIFYILIVASILLLAFLLGLYSMYRKKNFMARDLQALNAELEKKNTLLQENNEFHQQLIAILTHDLRQPFSSILMLNKGSMAESMDREALQFAIEQIETSAQTGLQIMDGVLHWMKLQVLGIQFQPNMVSVTESIKEALVFNERQILEKQIKVTCLIEDDALVAAQNEILLFVHRNIIQNAIRHMPVGGELTFDRELCANGFVNISITDNGPGIPQEILPILFKKERFNSRSKEKSSGKGAGLALVICWEMLHRMGGTLTAFNRPEGGACFTYQLPLLSHSQSSQVLKEAIN